MNDARLCIHAEAPPAKPPRRWLHLGSLSRVFLGLCLLAFGWMLMRAASDYARGRAGEKSIEQIEAVKREAAGRCVRVILKADELERALDDAQRRTLGGAVRE